MLILEIGTLSTLPFSLNTNGNPLLGSFTTDLEQKILYALVLRDID